MAHRTLIKGGTVITVDPALGDLPVGDVLVAGATIVEVRPELTSRHVLEFATIEGALACGLDGKIVKRDGKLVGVDHARVRRLAIESRDDILERADGQAGALIGGDRIPKAYEAVAADA